MFYRLARPLVFRLDAERAHELTLRALRAMPPGKGAVPELKTRVAGLDFANPVGLAAGFDKNGEAFGPMLRLGFGFVEVGTVTPLPQAGNPKPRLFRLAEDRAVINRMGFNNDGLDAVRARLARRRPGGPPTSLRTGIVGANVGANKDNVGSDAAVADYAKGVAAMAPVADYVTINISSPNTPGLRGLQDEGALAELLAAVMAAKGPATLPIFLKLAPDLDRSDIDAIARVAGDAAVDALIVSNTTVSRPPLHSAHRGEAGGLSGAPLKALALERLSDFRSATGGAIPLIAAGGIETGADAYARIRAGASLVQLYSALVYEGPGLARTIVRDLRRLLKRDGFRTVAEAVAT